MKWLLCELILSCMASATPMTLDELTYRTVLFDYYQERYDDALVNTLVAEAQGRTGENDSRFTLARGSFAFKDGMYGYARETFDSVAPEELTTQDRLRLAFHLARVHHQREDWSSLSRELSVISGLESQLQQPLTHPEVNFMRVELALAQQDTAAARSFIATLPQTDPLYAYAMYNLAVLERALGDEEAAVRTFEQLVALDARAEDSFDLVQRARLALAFMARKRGALADAEGIIKDLPGEGRYRDVALASYGNLAMREERNELAARIWLTLQQDGGWTSSAAAARLGFPMSLEALAEPHTVLTHYQTAEHGFEQRLAALQSLVSRTVEPGWVQGLAGAYAATERDSEEDEDLLAAFLSRWETEIGHREWVEWLADERAHKLLTQWRELDGMKSYLSDLPGTLEGFAEVAQEQRRRAGAARDMLRNDGLLARRAELEARIGALVLRLDLLDQQTDQRGRDWYLALADADEQALLERLWELQDGFAQHAQTSRWQVRVQRLLGIVYYTLENDFAARRWALTRRAQALESALLEADQRIARVEAAESHFTAGAGASFESYAQRALHIVAQVDEALQQREQALAGLLRDRLNDETKRTEQYLFVTRVAIARATDRLAVHTIDGGDS